MGKRESDDNYDYMVAWLGDKHRLIECKDNIQWILQERDGKGEKRWRNVKFMNTREGVLRRVAGLPNASTLNDLPERYASVRGRGLRAGTEPPDAA